MVLYFFLSFPEESAVYNGMEMCYPSHSRCSFFTKITVMYRSFTTEKRQPTYLEMTKHSTEICDIWFSSVLFWYKEHSLQTARSYCFATSLICSSECKKQNERKENNNNEKEYICIFEHYPRFFFFFFLIYCNTSE